MDTQLDLNKNIWSPLKLVIIYRALGLMKINPKQIIIEDCFQVIQTLALIKNLQIII